MSFKVNIFPAKLSWSDAIDNLYKADSSEKIVRLVANPNNFDLLIKFQGVKRLWCFDINEKHLEIICNCKSIEQLYIENLKTDKLSKLSNLPELKILSLDTCLKIKTTGYSKFIPNGRFCEISRYSFRDKLYLV